MKPKAFCIDSYRHGIDVHPDTIGWQLIVHWPCPKKKNRWAVCAHVSEDKVRIVKFYGDIEVVDRKIKFCT